MVELIGENPVSNLCYVCHAAGGLPWRVGGTGYHLCLRCWLTHLRQNAQAVANGRRQTAGLQAAPGRAGGTGGRTGREKAGIKEAVLMTWYLVLSGLAGALVALPAVAAFLWRRVRREAAIARNVLRSTRNAVVTVDRWGRVTAVNEAFADAVGKRAGEMLGQRCTQVCGHVFPLVEVLRRGEARVGEEIKIVRPDGGVRYKMADAVPWFDGKKRLTGAMLVLRDITARKTRELELTDENARLQDVARRDSLTGVYNHHHLMRNLEAARREAGEKQSSLALLMIDIDYFKIYNDLHGHLRGDAVLREFAALLVAHRRDADLVARYGGDEFAVVLRDADSQTALEVAERLRHRIEEHDFPGRQALPGGRITASIGVAFYPTSARTMADLINRADAALYEAKRGARNRVELYLHGLREASRELDDDAPEALNAMRSLLLIMHARDRWSYHHAEQVLRYSTWIAEEMGLPRAEVGQLRLAAFLHDVGKIHIPPEILTKVEPLTAEEWAELRRHPVYGVDILRPFPAFNAVLPAVMHHHERFDGRGYPRGLAGREIPLMARIISVADAFDAMISNRPYRRGMSRVKAVSELAACRGTQFDPEVVRCFLAALGRRDRVTPRPVDSADLFEQATAENVT